MPVHWVLATTASLVIVLPADESGLYNAQRIAFWSQGGKAVAEQRDKLRAQLEDVYATASNLHSYVDHNRTGFRKILKKHDKMLTTVVSVEQDRAGGPIMYIHDASHCMV